MAAIKELFKAYYKNELPLEGGFVVCAFFDPHSTYARYEVIHYNNAKNIYNNDDGLTFLADGKKTSMLVEPVDYPEKNVEPTKREGFYGIPYRFDDVEMFTSKGKVRIMFGKVPLMHNGSFIVPMTKGNNFSYIFNTGEDVQHSIKDFFVKSLIRDANVPRNDAEKAARSFLKVIEYSVESKVA